MKNDNTKSNGAGFFILLFLIFMTLKLAEVGQVASWSWWWVTAPLWGPLAFLTILVIFFVLVAYFFMK